MSTLRVRAFRVFGSFCFVFSFGLVGPWGCGEDASRSEAGSSNAGAADAAGAAGSFAGSETGGSSGSGASNEAGATGNSAGSGTGGSSGSGASNEAGATGNSAGSGTGGSSGSGAGTNVTDGGSASQTAEGGSEQEGSPQGGASGLAGTGSETTPGGSERSVGGTAGEAGESRGRFEGVAQKGPFVRGTSIIVSELDENLSQTGSSFTSEIRDNSGRFEVDASYFTGPYAKLTANGFYFNEVLGEVSSAPLTLVALVDADGSSTVNVNILTHLETPRVEYLCGQGVGFEAAKKQAQAEVLAALLITLDDAPSSENLDIAGSSDADAALLAASVLLQGYLEVGELSELLSAVAADLREDGTLDEEAPGSLLMNAATLVDPASIRANIEQRYSELGVVAETGDFEASIARYRDEGPYPYVTRVVFPETGPDGPNLLHSANDGRTLESSQSLRYDLSAETPQGQPFRVRLLWTDPTVPWGAALGSDMWMFSQPQNWSVTDVFSSPDYAAIQDFTVTNSGIPSHLPMLLVGTGSMRIELYEGNAGVLTGMRTIAWAPGG
ncbi:MAG: hypothetical protein JW940_38130 [Polyangiaceae bacterium]|nr:hypothetical protein [Polyangiaceae bacterium]